MDKVAQTLANVATVAIIGKVTTEAIKHTNDERKTIKIKRFDLR